MDETNSSGGIGLANDQGADRSVLSENEIIEAAPRESGPLAPLTRFGKPDESGPVRL